MNSRFSLTKHASSSSGGTLRTQVQQITWRESLARWIMAGLQSRWPLKHAGKGVLSLLLVLVGWGMVVPTQADNLISGAGTLSGEPVIPQRYRDTDALDLATGNFTLLACVKLTKYNEGYSGTIFSKRGTENGWFFGVDGDQSSAANGTVKFKNERCDTCFVRSTQIISLGKTHDVAMIYKSGTAYLYIDGSLNGSYSISLPLRTDKPLVIGKEHEDRIKAFGQPHVWNGTLSDLQIHDVALTEEAVKAHDAACRDISNNPPTINSFSVSPKTGGAPLDVTFSAEAQDPDGDSVVTKYFIGKFVDGTIPSYEPLSGNATTLTDEGTYMLKAVATDSKGKSSEPAFGEVTVENYPPEIRNFSVFSPKNGVAPLNVTLSADVKDPNGDSFTLEYFVDGRKLSGTTDTLTAGYHTIKAVATDSKGKTSSAEEHINVEPNRPPTINNPSVSPKNGIVAGSTVTLNATVVDLDSVSFTVEYFVDGQKLPGNTVTLTEPGSHTVMVKAKDIEGNESVLVFPQPIMVQAANKAPTSCFTPSTVSPFEAPAVGELPEKITFTVCGGTLDDTTPTADFKYQWLVNGQVQSTKPGSFELSVDGTGDYTKLDDYKVELIVTDKEGLSTPVDDPVKMQKPTVVQVEPFNQPPVACFAINDPATPPGKFDVIKFGSAPLTIKLDASCSSDDGNNGKPVKYIWAMFLQNEDDIGYTPWNSFESTEPVPPIQTLETGGEYKVELTVEDDGKPTAKTAKSDAKYVTVNKDVLYLEPAGCSYPTGETCSLGALIPGKPFDLIVRVSEYVLEQHPVDGVSVSMTFPKDKLEITGVKKSDDAFDYVLAPLPSKIDKAIAKANIEGTFNWSAMAYKNGAATQEKFPNGADLLTISFAFKEGIGSDPISLGTDTKVTYSGQSRQLKHETTNLNFKSETTTTQQGTVTWEGRSKIPKDDTAPEGETGIELTFFSVKNDVSTPRGSAKVKPDGSFDFPALPDEYGYLCVKEKNTLATKIMPGISVIELSQGDSDGNGKIGSEDFKQSYNGVDAIPACDGSETTYRKLADLDGNDCVDSDPTNYPEGDWSLFDASNILFQEELEKSPKDRNRLCMPEEDEKGTFLGTYKKGQRSNDSGQVTFQTTPIPMGLPVGSTFEVQVLVNVDATHSVDGAAVSLNYDPQRLAVVSLTAGTQLDFVLKKKFDNTKGSLDFAAILWANKLPTDKFTLVTINFTLLGENGERTLSFNTTAPRETAAALAGEYVNAPVQPSAIKFAEKPLTYVISDYLLDQAGHPLAGVTIHIGDQTAVTNENGYWKITDLPEGSYTVTAQKDDYTFTTAPCALSREQMDCQMVKPKSLLKLTVDYPPEVTQQQEFDYTITVTNGSPQTVTGVTLTDTLPNGVAALSLDAATDGQCDLSTLTCNGLTLDAGASATFKLHVINLQSETLNNTLTVTANEQPAAVKTVTSTVKADFSVTVKDTPDPVEMLKDLQYEVTVALADQATLPATGVTLELTLPTGVTLKALSLEHGQCDTTTQLPKVICHLDDLSLEGVKQVPLTLTTSLHDAGLLLLTLQAQLSSNEYPTETARERTKVFVPPEIQVDLALVIDTTNSMQGEIDGVKAALKKFMATTDPNTAPLMTLITFKDEVSVKAFTRDLNVLLKVIDTLKAEGGGTCPEASVEALAFTVVHVKTGGQIWFSTDASPYPDADVQSVLDLLQSKNIRLHATVTGDCANSDSENGFAQAVNQ